MDPTAEAQFFGINSGITWGIYFVVLVIVVVAMWKIFAKADEPGWAAIIPIYNMIVLMKVVGRPWWWILLYAVPIVSIIIMFIVSIDLAKAFGKGAGFGVGIVFLPVIFYPILAFGSAQYEGAAA